MVGYDKGYVKEWKKDLDCLVNGLVSVKNFNHPRVLFTDWLNLCASAMGHRRFMCKRVNGQFN